VTAPARRRVPPRHPDLSPVPRPATNAQPTADHFPPERRQDSLAFASARAKIPITFSPSAIPTATACH